MRVYFLPWPQRELLFMFLVDTNLLSARCVFFRLVATLFIHCLFKSYKLLNAPAILQRIRLF